MQHEIVTVVASGWSASLALRWRMPGHVIAVNDSAYWLTDRPDEIVSMDRMWAELRWQWLLNAEISTWLRRTCVQNLLVDSKTPRTGDPSWLTVYDCEHELMTFASEPLRLNGRNSGAVALNLAWRYRPKYCYLVGFDMQPGPRGELRWHPSYPAEPQRGGKTFVNTGRGKFNSWSEDFAYIGRQFRGIGAQIYLVSGEYSRIKSLPSLSADEFMLSLETS